MYWKVTLQSSTSTLHSTFSPPDANFCSRKICSRSKINIFNFHTVTYRFISSSYTKYVNRSPSFEKLKCMLKQTTCEFPSDEKNVTVLSCLFLTNKHHRVLEIITEIIDFFLLK